MVDATLLNRGSASPSIATAAVSTLDIEVMAGDTLVVEVTLVGGAADADLTVTVRPIAIDGTTVFPIAMAAIGTVGPTHVAGTVYFQGRYDVSAQNRVRIEVKNNNAATKTANINWQQN